jgi:tyrosyl-tRNA synthetase
VTAKRASKKDLPPDAEGILARGVIEIIPRDEFLDALRSGRKLRLKFGLDPSKPDLHIGHAVLLRKLRRLQELGHQVVLIVGDWTAQIGDPSGQSITRPMLTAEEVRANAETYMRQFFHVVDRERTEIRWQSEWFDNFTLADVVRLTSRFTVAQMLQRDDFRQRFDAQKPLGVHELLYPLLQAYDSVVIEADVEFGGSDQLFNLLVGRELQQDMGQRPQSCFVMRLLVGTDGAQKMSKSLGNTIDLEDPPGEQYGKVMSIPDSALLDYLELTTDIPDEELAFIRKQLEDRSVNPMEIKKRLAREIVAQFHGASAAQDAEAEFERVFQQGGTPEILWKDLPFAQLITIGISPAEVLSAKGAPVMAATLVAMATGISMSEARRLIEQGAVEIDGKRATKKIVNLKPGSTIRIGRHHFFRIVDASKSS